jgi:hypothetical protein
MSSERKTAREILATVFSEATGQPRALVAAILDSLPMPEPARDFSPEEAEQWLARLRRELPEIRAWLRAGAAEFEARLAAARRDAIRNG